MKSALIVIAASLFFVAIAVHASNDGLYSFYARPFSYSVTYTQRPNAITSGALLYIGTDGLGKTLEFTHDSDGYRAYQDVDKAMTCELASEYKDGTTAYAGCVSPTLGKCVKIVVTHIASGELPTFEVHPARDRDCPITESH